MGFDEVTYALLKKMIGRGSSDEQGSFIPSYGVIGSIALGTSWSGNDPYTQTVTLTGYTPTNGTMVSVLPDTSVLTQMASDGINEIFITNNNGTLTATAIGGRSTAAMTLYVLCSETDVAETINGLSVDVSDLKNAISQLQPTATASDVGKALIVKAVDAQTGKPTEYEYGEAGGSSEVVTDVIYSDEDLNTYISVDSAPGANQYVVVMAPNETTAYFLKSASVKAAADIDVKFSVFDIKPYYDQPDPMNRKKFIKAYDIDVVKTGADGTATISFGVPLRLVAGEQVLVAACNESTSGNRFKYGTYKNALYTIWNYSYSWYDLNPGEYNPNAYQYATSGNSPYYSIEYVLASDANAETQTAAAILQQNCYVSPYDDALNVNSDNAVRNKTLVPYLVSTEQTVVNNAQTTYLSGGKQDVDGMAHCYAISCDVPTYGEYDVSHIEVRAMPGETITFGLWELREIQTNRGYWTLKQILGTATSSVDARAEITLESPVTVDGDKQRIFATCVNKKIGYRKADFTPNPYKRSRINPSLFNYSNDHFSSVSVGTEVSDLLTFEPYKGWDYNGAFIANVGAYEITYTPTVSETITKSKRAVDWETAIDEPIGSLHGKVWYCAGDSTTYGIEEGRSYAEIIAERNGMELWKDGISGSVMTSYPDAKLYIAFSLDRYLNIPENVDFVTLWFGINDSTMGYPVGELDSDDPATFCGAYNKVLTWIINNRPNARVGLVVTHRAGDNIKNAIRNLAKKYGFLVFDLHTDPRIPFWHPTDSYYANDVDAAVKTLRTSQWWTESVNSTHPLTAGYEAISYPFESWLRSL